MKFTKFASWLKSLSILILICCFTPTVTAENYYPAQVGNTWVLLSTDGVEQRTYTLEHPQNTDVEGLIKLKITKEILGTGVTIVDAYWITVENDGGLMLHQSAEDQGAFGIAEATFDPPVTFLPAELPLGQTWEIISETQLELVGAVSITRTITVVAIEDVETPAGVFKDCVKLEINQEFVSAIAVLSNTSYQWLAPDVGPVKYLNAQDILYELQSYNLSEQVINIPDPNLRAAIAEALDKSPEDPITRAEMETLVELRANSRDITDLRGIEFAINLTSLHLWRNNISDISPLSNLTNLTYLNLGANNISNIVPLIALTNLTHLHIHSNNISDIEMIERLMAQGTVVYFAGNPAFETPGPKIEDGWIWLIVEATDVDSGSDAARSGRDFLSEASGGAVTEADVAFNGASAGTQIGNSVWTSAPLNAADSNNLNAIVSDHNLGTDIDYPVAYSVVPIQSETQQQTRVYIGGGPVKVWLNGALIYKDTAHRGVTDYETAVPVLLILGENLLFIAAYRPNPFEDWGAFFGFQDGTGYTVGAPGAGSLDVNGDGQVTVIDLAIVALFYGTRVPVGVSLPADVNADGIVDLLDLTAVAQGIDDPGDVFLQELEAAVLAAAEHAVGLEVIAEAPIGFGRHQHALSGDIVYGNVAAALADARLLAKTGDARLRKGIDLLETLLELLTEIRAIPETTTLLPNYPNPFNPETWIPYQLAKDAEVTVMIYNVRGGVVRQLMLGYQRAGVYVSRSRAAYWDGKNKLGEPVASGVYFYTLTAREFTATRKMLIRK